MSLRKSPNRTFALLPESAAPVPERPGELFLQFKAIMLLKISHLIFMVAASHYVIESK
jgi:hypothetical protein